MKEYKVKEKQLNKLLDIRVAFSNAPDKTPYPAELISLVHTLPFKLFMQRLDDGINIICRELSYLIEDIENQPLEDANHAR